MKTLITGGAGFLGSHLAEALIARGDTVYVLDNLSTGSIENIEHLKTDRRFHYAIDSVINEPVTAELIDRVDVVFHLAAQADVGTYDAHQRHAGEIVALAGFEGIGIGETVKAMWIRSPSFRTLSAWENLTGSPREIRRSTSCSCSCSSGGISR